MGNLEVRKQLPKDALVFDNSAFDNSIIGVTLDGRVIYSFEKMVEELVNDDGMEELDAIELIEHNTSLLPQRYGDKVPLIVHEGV